MGRDIVGKREDLKIHCIELEITKRPQQKFEIIPRR